MSEFSRFCVSSANIRFSELKSKKESLCRSNVQSSAADALPLAALGTAVWLLTPREPIHNGKRLRVWLDNQRMVDGARIELADESVRAVRAVGSNAIPCLVAMLHSSDSQAKLRLTTYLQRYPFLQRRIPIGATKRRRAMYGFRALGLESRQPSRRE